MWDDLPLHYHLIMFYYLYSIPAWVDKDNYFSASGAARILPLLSSQCSLCPFQLLYMLLLAVLFDARRHCHHHRHIVIIIIIINIALYWLSNKKENSQFRKRWHEEIFPLSSWKVSGQEGEDGDSSHHILKVIIFVYLLIEILYFWVLSKDNLVSSFLWDVTLSYIL